MPANYSWLLIHYLKPYRFQMSGLWIVLLGTIAAQLVNPQIIRRFLDAAENGQSLGVLLSGAGLFLVIAVVEQLLGLLSTYFSINVGWHATNQMREDLALHCLTLDLEFHKNHSPGEMIERIDGDINALGNFFSRLALNLLNNFLLLLGVLVLLWWEDWRVGGVVSLIALCGLLAVNTIRAAAVPHWQQVRQAIARLYGSLEEWLGGTEDIRANGATAYIMRRMFERLRTLYTKSYRPMLFQMAGLAVPILTFGLAYIALFILGDFLVLQQGMTIGTVYLLFYYLGLLSGPLWQIVNEVRDLQTAGASLGRVQALLQTSSRIRDLGQQSLPGGPLGIEFADVTFRYEAVGETVLHNVNFQLAPGELLGLLGRTGNGKTTLMRLLVRLIDPISGSVRLGNSVAETLDIRDVPLSTLRQRVSMVTQDVQLFQGTLRDNLTFFDETIPEAQLRRVANNLGLDEWLARLPEGLNTELVAGGQGLSAGEAQLVAFMRVFLQDPGLVILDEASSRLDPFTERLLDRAMGRLLENRTGIIIAHRLETVHRTDKIMILAQGRVVEYGERAALAQDINTKFHTLLQHNEDHNIENWEV